MSGFRARIFQHNMDHIYGRVVFNWRLNFGNMKLKKEIVNYFPNSE